MSLDKRNQMIGGNLRYFRTSKKLSIRELAKMSNIPHTTLARIERGEGTASPALIEKIASVLEITQDDLLKEDIAGTLEFLIRYFEESNSYLLGPILFWLGKSLQGPLKEKALKTALEHAQGNEILYHNICYDLAQFYEETDIKESLHFYKEAAGNIFAKGGLYNK